MPTAFKWAIALASGLGIVVLGWRLANSAWFFWILPTFFIVNCFVLIIVVLLQSGKAADLAGAFGGAGSQTAFGPRGAANVLSRATTWCAIMFMVCALALVLQKDKAAGVSGSGSVLEKVSKPAPVAPKQAPAPSGQAPAQGQPQTQTPQPAAPQGGAQSAPTSQQQPPAKKP
jgi:preprotein translocase subunit SecG